METEKVLKKISNYMIIPLGVISLLFAIAGIAHYILYGLFRGGIDINIILYFIAFLSFIYLIMLILFLLKRELLFPKLYLLIVSLSLLIMFFDITHYKFLKYLTLILNLNISVYFYVIAVSIFSLILILNLKNIEERLLEDSL